MIATPASSTTTPTSSGAAVREGPTNMVTAGSSVSKAVQWWRYAWVMSSSETPCLRALASMSTLREYRRLQRSSTKVDAADRPSLPDAKIAARLADWGSVPSLPPAPTASNRLCSKPSRSRTWFEHARIAPLSVGLIRVSSSGCRRSLPGGSVRFCTRC